MYTCHIQGQYLFFPDTKERKKSEFLHRKRVERETALHGIRPLSLSFLSVKYNDDDDEMGDAEKRK